ncbi:hypothetical protein EDD29_6023 [Actinocorallia herbida]|uniref:Uncharacterized protein n=1 Tax=Actinocorallia herbida TaxID=58109 RepID=A0A3N1D4B1_9ACTN|nr:hypothetical protein [Actinocorallia herbida]ROO88357.1 hypothetical protein EDD29_6023 [Actinocorallia herbida]
MSDADDADARLRAAARELAEIAHALREAAGQATAVLADPALAASLRLSPGTGLRAQRALLRAVTDRRGLGWAVTGGRAGTLGAKLGGLVNAGNLPIRVMTTSLRLRIAAVARGHPELGDDPKLRGLLDAVAADSDLAAGRALYALVKDRGAAGALSSVAPVFGELLALRALLDRNPLNDATAWLIATGMGTATADPLTGMSNRVVAGLDRGRGAAVPVEPAPHEAARLSPRGSFLDYLADLLVIRPTGRALVQTVRGPDGVARYVVLAPGMRIGRPQTEHPADLLGAFSSTVLDDGPYSRSLAAAIAEYGVPEGAEVAFVGHSAGGSAVMSLAQDPAFNARHLLTDVIAIGSPVDFKQPASPATRVASVTNQHDIIPTLDGQGAGNCFALHPDWYIVDYTDGTHLFPACHGLEQYAANLRDDLPEARAHLEAQLAAYTGPIVRRRLYRLLDHAPVPPGFPFLTVPTHPVAGPAGPVTVPLLTHEATAVSAWFAVSAEAAAGLLPGGSPGTALHPVVLGSRAWAVLHLTDHRSAALGPYREFTLSLAVHSPPRPHRRALWRDALRPPALRHAGLHPLASLVTSPAALDAAALWPHSVHLAEADLSVAAGSLAAAASDTGRPLVAFDGPLGPRLPARAGGHPGYTGPNADRSVRHVRGPGTVAHPLPRIRLHASTAPHPFTAVLRALSLDGARPVLVRVSPAAQLRRDAPAPLRPPGGSPA